MVDSNAEISVPSVIQNKSDSVTSTEKNDQSDSYYYLRNPFPKEAKRVVDVIKRKTVVESADRKVDRLEGKLSLNEAKDGFKQAERIFISITTEPIGDAVVATGYIEAVRQALQLQGREVPITLVVSRHHEGLFDGYKNQGIEVIQADAGTGRDISTTLSSLAPENNSLILDVGKYHESPRTSVSATQERKTTTMSGLLGVGVEMYNNSSDGVSRYSHFVEDIFNLPTNSIIPEKAQPLIELPANKEDVYKEVATRCGIDISKPQITVSVEASVLGKRYDMKHWVEVISLLKKSHPDYTFNIIHKPDSNIDGFKIEDIQNALNEGGVLGDCHLVSGNLTEMAVLMEKQKLVLSNDTGLAHIAGALKNGPPVLTLFSPRGAPESKFWISNQKKQRAITLPPSAVLDFPDGYDVYRGDQTNRPINRIPPQTVANVALEKLNAA